VSFARATQRKLRVQSKQSANFRNKGISLKNISSTFWKSDLVHDKIATGHRT